MKEITINNEDDSQIIQIQEHFRSITAELTK